MRPFHTDSTHYTGTGSAGEPRFRRKKRYFEPESRNRAAEMGGFAQGRVSVAADHPADHGRFGAANVIEGFDVIT